jgi:hypothetical protein
MLINRNNTKPLLWKKLAFSLSDVIILPFLTFNVSTAVRLTHDSFFSVSVSSDIFSAMCQVSQHSRRINTLTLLPSRDTILKSTLRTKNFVHFLPYFKISQSFEQTYCYWWWSSQKIKKIWDITTILFLTIIHNRPKEHLHQIKIVLNIPRLFCVLILDMHVWKTRM